MASWSPVFERMLTSDMKESKENNVIINNIKTKNVRDMLNYMYTNIVEDLSKKATDLLPVAEKYKLTGLKEMCSKALIKARIFFITFLYNVPVFICRTGWLMAR